MNVNVIGLGHIGLPLACWIALKNIHVTGIDISTKALEEIRNGSISIEERFNGEHIGSISSRLCKDGLLDLLDKFERKDSTPCIFLVAVGISDNPDGTQDISPIKKAILSIKDKLKDGDLIMLRTTLIPGTCDNLVLPLLKGIDAKIHFAYCPETLMETKAFFELENNQMILAGKTSECYEIAFQFLRSLTKAKITRASSLLMAEMTKVVQNIHRDVNIALANEISDACSELSLNIYELQSLVNTHPRVDLLTPGPGVGGYCLPNAYRYLKASLSNPHSTIPIVKLSRENNILRPKKIVDKVASILNETYPNKDSFTVSVLGLAMKDFCADSRFSPALDIVKELLFKGFNVKSYDPITNTSSPTQIASLDECIENCDCLIIAANQEGFEEALNLLNSENKLPKIIIDTRNIFESNKVKVSLI